MKYLLRVNVIHDRVSLPAGSVCPDEFVSNLLAQGLLDKIEGHSEQAEAKAPTPAKPDAPQRPVAPQASVPQNKHFHKKGK